MDAAPLIKIGVVHSPIKTPGAMPGEGVAAQVEILPAFAPALDAIEENSHLIILGWFHLASRNTLNAGGRSGARERGVFGLRSSARPNPVGMAVAKLLKIDRPNRLLYLDRLDFVDGTPVIDLKRYSAPWDSVFAARTTRDLELGRRSEGELLDELARCAENFHGEWCQGAAVGARLLASALTTWRIGPRHPDLKLCAGGDGCTIDALQGMTGATIGNKRLTITNNPSVELTLPDRESWLFHPATNLTDPPDALVQRRLSDLGTIEVRSLTS